MMPTLPSSISRLIAILLFIAYFADTPRHAYADFAAELMPRCR